MFKPGHFKEVGLIKLWLESDGFEDAGVPQQIAKIANALLPELKKQWLEELLADAPTVYGGERLDGSGNLRFEQDQGDFPWDVTHTAKLVDIKEIEG